MQVEGTGIYAKEIKLATKQKILLPQDLQEYLHQMSNYWLLLHFIFGIESIIYKSFLKVVQHASNYENKYEGHQIAVDHFYPKIINFFDQRVQLFIGSCNSASSFGTINFGLLGFDEILQDIIDGCVDVNLPIAIQWCCLPKQQQKHQQPHHDKPHIAPPVNIKQQALGGYNAPLPIICSDLEVNDHIFPTWKLRPSEDFWKVFVADVRAGN